MLKTQEFDGKLSPSEVKGCVAALTFIVLSITRVHSSTFHGDDVRLLDGTVVTNELHQLGLTKEAAEGEWRALLEGLGGHTCTVAFGLFVRLNYSANLF